MVSDRVAKLLRLAENNPNAQEAESARRKAREIMEAEGDTLTPHTTVTPTVGLPGPIGSMKVPRKEYRASTNWPPK